MAEAKLTGGTEQDRQEILKLHERYIDVNTRFDWQNLQPIFSPAPEATFFNLNGHTYNGREHWTRLWKFYGQNVSSSYWTPFDIGGAVTNDLAVVWCHRNTKRQWTGKEPPPKDINYSNQEFISRSTMVFRKEDGQWRVVHVHFSPATPGHAQGESSLPGLPRLSVRLHGGMTPQLCVEQARAAEAAGIDAVWFAENPFARGIMAAATACALATRTQSIGAGVFNPYGRHPSLIAMEIGALDELSGGRVRLGIGSGLGSAVERMGFSTKRSLTALREAITIIRALLRGEEVTFAGAAFNVNRLKLDYGARADIPIFMAARGANAVKACGEIADGMIVSNMCAAGFVAKSVQSLHDAARAAGFERPPGVVQYMPCVPRPNRAEAHAAAKRAVADMLPNYWALAQRLPDAKAALMDGSGISEDDFAAAVTRLKAGDEPATALDDRFVEAFTIAGTADDCRELASRYAAAGTTELALTFFGPTFAADMAYIGKAFGMS